MNYLHWKATILATILITICTTSFVTSAPAVAAPAQPEGALTRAFSCVASHEDPDEELAVLSSEMFCLYDIAIQAGDKAAEIGARPDVTSVSWSCRNDATLSTRTNYIEAARTYVAVTMGQQTCDFFFS